MPVCLEGRFAKEGVPQHIELPLPSPRLSPITDTTIPDLGTTHQLDRRSLRACVSANSTLVLLGYVLGPRCGAVRLQRNFNTISLKTS